MDTKEGAFLVYVTTPTREEAVDLARALVHLGLAAGVNILPGAQSVYRWKGAVCEAAECLLLAQASEEALEPLIREVRARHSYEVPCIIALSIGHGHSPFLRWIAENSRPSIK